MKVPVTSPRWIDGRYSVQVDDELVGYFRQFQSAWAWREYIRSQKAHVRILIYDRGTLVNVSEPVKE